jgi:hypothetical protein
MLDRSTRPYRLWFRSCEFRGNFVDHRNFDFGDGRRHRLSDHRAGGGGHVDHADDLR